MQQPCCGLENQCMPMCLLSHRLPVWIALTQMKRSTVVAHNGSSVLDDYRTSYGTFIKYVLAAVQTCHLVTSGWACWSYMLLYTTSSMIVVMQLQRWAESCSRSPGGPGARRTDLSSCTFASVCASATIAAAPVQVLPCVDMRHVGACLVFAMCLCCRRKADPIIEAIEQRLAEWSRIPAVHAEDIQASFTQGLSLPALPQPLE